MPHALTLGWYVVPAVVILIVSFISFAFFTVLHVGNKSSITPDERYAKYALASLASFVLAFAWPLSILFGTMFLVFTLVRDLFASNKEK